MDDNVGVVMDRLKDNGLDDNTIVVFTTDNGAENYTWPDGGNTPFAGGKGPCWKAGFGCRSWPAGLAISLPAKSRTGIMSGLDCFPTLRRSPATRRSSRNAPRQTTRRQDLQGSSRRLRPNNLITGKGLPSVRGLVFRGTTLRRDAHRRLEVPFDRPAERLDWRHGAS